MEHTTICPPLTRRELDGAAVSKKAAKDGMVLLRNRAHTLPLTPGTICLFGNGAARTIRGGTGSGDPFNGGLSGGGDVRVDLSPRYHIQLLPAMQKAGFTVLTEEMLLRIGERFDEGLRRMENRVMSSFTLPEEAIPEAAARAYAAQTDTAICVISRNSGEGTDRAVEDDSKPIIGANSESVPGAAGETTHSLAEAYGIPSLVMADGPGGVRVAQCYEATNIDTGKKQTVYHYCIAWPIGTLLAQTFDRALVREVGEAMNADLRAMHLDILLGPGVNIQRNPLCGRNFEYFSEDPLLAGEMAAAVTQGIQKDNTAAACVKHLALNNQETNRHANNSVAGQRAMREIYLEPFRIAVMQGGAMALMTSYNLINGIPSADAYDLCTDLARGEWGFDGLIMTDWNGGSSTPSKSMHAGNDLIMPGGVEKSTEILTHLKKLAPEFDPNGQVKRHRVSVPFAECYLMLWHSCVPCADGDTELRAALGEGYTAQERDGLILVNGEKIYAEAATVFDAFRLKERYQPLKTPVDTRIARVEDGGKTIVYRVKDAFRQTICRGDVQRCAANILKVMLRLDRHL